MQYNKIEFEKMNSIRMLFVIFFMFTLNSNLKAQNWSLRSGLNFVNFRVDYDDPLIERSKIVRPQFGIFYEQKVKERLFIETGLMHTTKGDKWSYHFTYQDENFSFEEKVFGYVNVNYIELLVNIKVIKSVGKYQIYGAVGPYIANGLYGKIKRTIDTNGNAETEKLKLNFGNSIDDVITSFDYGLNFTTGLKVQKWSYNLHYGLGIANLIPADFSDEESMRNRAFGLSVSYYFKRN